jgi:hypothetical protein
MKKEKSRNAKSTNRPQTIHGSRRSLLFTLLMIASVLSLAVGSTLLPRGISANSGAGS